MNSNRHDSVRTDCSDNITAEHSKADAHLKVMLKQQQVNAWLEKHNMSLVM